MTKDFAIKLIEDASKGEIAIQQLTYEIKKKDHLWVIDATFTLSRHRRGTALKFTWPIYIEASELKILDWHNPHYDVVSQAMVDGVNVLNLGDEVRAHLDDMKQILFNMVMIQERFWLT